MVRLLSGLALAAAALAAILFLPPLGIRVLVVIVALAAAAEYLHIVGGSLRAPGSPAVLVVLTAWTLAAGVEGALVALAAFALLHVGGEVLFRAQPLADMVTRQFAVLYVAMPLGLLAATHRLGGPEAVLLLVGTVVVSDSMQYYTGRMLGRRPLAPAISPKKTIEGALGGVVFGTLFMVLAGRYVFPLATVVVLAAAGASVVALGIAGDLFESRLKRTAGLKDSSTLIPGHGGILDRIDALIFATPVFWVFLHRLM